MLHKDKQIGRPQIPYQDTEANLNNLNLTSSDKGCISYATDTDKFLYWDGSTWAEVGGNVPDASTTEKGIVELATDAEAQAGTATTVVITPANLRADVPATPAASRGVRCDASGNIIIPADGRFGGGVYVGGNTDAATGTLTTTDYIVALGGAHIGGTSDPGTDNLLVDGNATITGTLSAGVMGGWLPFSPFSTEAIGGGITSDNLTLYAVVIPRTVTVDSYTLVIYVATTNNSSNYWNFYLQKFDGTTIATITTNGNAVNANTVESITGIGVSVGTADYGLKITTDKVGSPGTAYVSGPAIYVK